MIWHIIAYPIRGIRLARLYNQQTLTNGGDVDIGSSQSCMNKLQNAGNIQEIVRLQHGLSVRVTGTSSPANTAQVRNMLEKGQLKSVSMIYADSLLAIQTGAGVELKESLNQTSWNDSEFLGDDDTGLELSSPTPTSSMASCGMYLGDGCKDGSPKLRNVHKL